MWHLPLVPRCLLLAAPALRAQSDDRRAALAGIDSRAQSSGEVTLPIRSLCRGRGRRHGLPAVRRALRRCGCGGDEHPGDRNAARTPSTLVNITGRFRFSGVLAQASSAPDRGRSALDGDLPPIDSAATVFMPETGIGRASADLGDVSWNMPTGAATRVPGTPAHSWQAVAAGSISTGAKGMLVAATSRALAVMDRLSNAARLQQARAEFDRRRGPAFKVHDAAGGLQTRGR